jgi:two-component system sensor histidine kinase BarA
MGMKSLGIKYQLRIITLIPVLLVALIFALFYNFKYNNDLKQHIARLGQAYINQLLPFAQFALLHNDRQLLQELINASNLNPEIKSAAFYNANGQLLAYRGGKHLLRNPFSPPQFMQDSISSKQLTPYSINFVAAITTPKIDLYTAPYTTLINPDANVDHFLGWLSIDVDSKFMLIKHYQMYLAIIFITLSGLLITSVIHYILSRRIYRPIARLRRSMKQILSNEFETEINVSSGGELGIIEQGCSHLQNKYLSTIRELNQHIEVATTDLQQGLELLEEKNIELSLDKKKTEERSRQKSEFIANMSHEIRTPMNGIIGFTNVLIESKLDPLQSDYVKTIKSSAQDLLSIINDILDYSKMDAGKLHLESIPLNIRACIDEVLALIAPNAHQKDIDVIPITAVEVPKTVLGDPWRIKQIISNLVSNAVKFTDYGYVLIRTSIESETEQDYTLRLSISDTGIGISAEDQTTLFSAFKQADATIARQYGGSGLGLVISKKLAEHMHGRISVTSEPHKGTTFSVYLKLGKLMAYEVEKHQTNRFAHLNVLCFDDNPLHLEALCSGLGYWGINCVRIHTFNQLEEALHTHSECKLAFINVNQGCEHQVSQIIKKQTIPCLLISKWYIQDYQALGAQGLLFKPPNLQKLFDAIEAVLTQATHHTKTNLGDLENLRIELRRAKPHILIAEDNPVNRMLLNSLLGENASIETVQDGEQTVAICHQKRFSAILLDLQMPKLNGLDAARIIRQESMLNKNTPIILISANTNDLPPELLQKSGINLCIQKPIEEKHLLQHLLQVIDKTTVSPINWSLCLQKVSGNHALAVEFLARFVEELHENRKDFLQFHQQGNLQSLERLAHKLHGACCFCGVTQLQRHVASIENIAKHAQHVDELHSIFPQLIESIDAVLSEYQHSHQIYAKEISCQ